MNKRIGHFLPLFLTLLILSSCSTPEARRPVQVRSGSFIQQSAQRSKKLLAEEEKLIEKLIAQDSSQAYIRSGNGYWYTVIERDSSLLSEKPENFLPTKGDRTQIRLEYQKLNGSPYYLADTLRYYVDEQAVFPGLQSSIKEMYPGDKLRFFFPSALAFGYPGDGDQIAPNSPIRAEIELLELIKKQDSTQN
jgi:gliding motility-associated peptidyl-prolyl isomerase